MKYIKQYQIQSNMTYNIPHRIRFFSKLAMNL